MTLKDYSTLLLNPPKELDYTTMSEEDASLSAELESEEDEEDSGAWDDWREVADEEEGAHILCLFCSQRWASAASLFEHCKSVHAFDFMKLQKQYSLGFYDCIRLINFIRSQVDINKCWHCGCIHDCQDDLQRHLLVNNHVNFSSSLTNIKCEDELQTRPDGIKSALQHEKYLTPFLKDDPLLYSFEEIMDDDPGLSTIVDHATVLALIDADVKSNVASAEISNVRGFTPFAADDSIVDITKHQQVKKIQTHSKLPMQILSESDTSFSNSKILDSSYSCLLRSVDAAGKELPYSGRSNCKDDTPAPEQIVHDQKGPGNCGLASQASQISNKTSKSLPSQTRRRKVSFSNVAKKERDSINQTYFGAYSAFGIHREMLSDKVRTEAYQKAILGNPALFKDAVVMDVGCGTGILSLFAAKAGAKKVIAVEASQKMASIAAQVVKANRYRGEVAAENGSILENKGIINVVHGMIEELDELIPIGSSGVDVLLSEWMGYCLLFESMLGSVLYARNRWLKPGGAILPDKAEMFVAGFGRGGTSLPFWENVYGFDMKCIGQEVMEHAAETPIIDVLESKDVITDARLIHDFDILSIQADDVDFTATFELSALANYSTSGHQFTEDHVQNGEESLKDQTSIVTTERWVWCYGVVVWFDVAFSSRYCKHNPVRLSTSPHFPRTHWSQTLLTFKEPIALLQSQSLSSNHTSDGLVIGTNDSPASTLKGRISVARSSRHRSIDISLETTAVGPDGGTRPLPVQIFEI